VAINIQFQNLAAANSEILKAFNSAQSAKALEAYQPLSPKERKLQKLRALQTLKQSSDSASLAEISLSTDSLAIALTKAEGATLQAMLNLLSAKMIEQNKYSFFAEEERDKLKNQVQQKLDQHHQEKQEDSKQDDPKQEEEKEPLLIQMADAALDYFKQMQESLLAQYKQVLSAISLQNLKQVFNQALGLLHKYAYEVPIESFNEYVINPINEFVDNLRRTIDEGFTPANKKVFTHKEIKGMLQEALDLDSKTKLRKSIENMNKTAHVQKNIHEAKRKIAVKDLRLVLHR
jgi:hypothetical protein